MEIGATVRLLSDILDAPKSAYALPEVLGRRGDIGKVIYAHTYDYVNVQLQDGRILCNVCRDSVHAIGPLELLAMTVDNDVL